MYNSKIIGLLKTLSETEFKRFEDFVMSPFFNKSQKGGQLFDAIKDDYPEFNSERLSKESIYNKLYPGKEYNDERIRNLSSDLLNLGKEFLAQMKFLSDPFYPAKFLLDGLKEKKLDALYNKHLKLTNDYLENDHRFDGNYFLYKINLEISRIKFYLSRNILESYFNSYLDFSELMAVYLLLELVAASEGINRSEIMLNLNLKNNLADMLINSVDFEKSIDHLREKGSKYADLVEMYYSKYNALLNADEDKYYFKYKDLFYSNINMLSRSEKYNLYTDVLAICISKVRAGKENFRRETFEVYKKMLDEGTYAYSENDFMNVEFYQGIVNRCVALKEIDWLEKFTKQYSGKLDPAYIENLRLYSEALINFIKKDFEKTLEYLSRINSAAFGIKLDIKNFSLMSYYELDAHEQALSLIDTYEHFLLKNKNVSTNYKVLYGNFIKYAGLLIKIKLNLEKYNLVKLNREIIDCLEIANKHWLLEKTEELNRQIGRI